MAALEARHFQSAIRAKVAPKEVRNTQQGNRDVVARNTGVVRHIVPKISSDPTAVADVLLSTIRFHRLAFDIQSAQGSTSPGLLVARTNSAGA